jgi:protease PrsW
MVLAQTGLTQSQLFWFALAGALGPCLAWLAFFYSKDRYDPEPKWLIAKLFLIGAFPVAILAGVINASVFAVVPSLFFVAVIVAPLNEEAVKYLGTSVGSRRKKAFDEPVDGMIYGTSVGLGFAAAETVDYLIVAYTGEPLWGGDAEAACAGLACFAFVAVIRGVGTALVHALCSGIAGYFLARRVLDAAPRSTAVAGILLASLFHALWNGTGLLLGFLVLGVAAVVYARLMARALHRSPHHGRQMFPHAPDAWFTQVPPPPR